MEIRKFTRPYYEDENNIPPYRWTSWGKYSSGDFAPLITQKKMVKNIL